MKIKISILLMVIVILAGCTPKEDENYVPKPRGYMRLEIDVEKSYRPYPNEGCPYSFEIPEYANVTVKESSEADTCFRNIEFPDFKATVYLTYKAVDDNVAQNLEQSRRLLVNHQIKATGIKDSVILRPDERVYGMIHYLKGDAASNCVFYLTDSVNHYIHGSLYFYAPPQYDSLKPVLSFITSDIEHLVSTFAWK